MVKLTINIKKIPKATDKTRHRIQLFLGKKWIEQTVLRPLKS